MDGSEDKKVRRMDPPPGLRDWTLFLAGLAGVGHETIVAPVADPTLIAVFAAMLGLPFFLRKDERK